LAQVALLLVADDPEDIERVFRLTGDLRDQLLAYDMEEVEFVRGPAPPGAKAGIGELVTGALVVATTIRGGGLRILVDALQMFLRRHDGHRIHMRVGDRELTIDGAASKDVSAAVNAFLSVVEADAEDDNQ
jgi:hypothetical protein